VALVGLEAYRVNLAILREKLDDGTLSRSLQTECNQRHTGKIELIRNQAPKKVEDKDGWRYKYYDHGVVEIGPVDPNNAPTTIHLNPADLT
jgi:hypothetical protein